MVQILKMAPLDLFWGIPFLFLSILVMTRFFDALFRIRHIAQTIKSHKKERDSLSNYLKSGNLVGASKIIDSSKDPLIHYSASVLNAYLHNRINDYGALRKDVKDVLNGILKVPHELIFEYFCTVILTIGFAGTLLSFFCMLINFDSNGGFSLLFAFLAVGIKSSLFSASSAILMTTGHVWLRKKVEAEKEMLINEDFYKNLIWISNSPSAETNEQRISPDKNGKKVIEKESCDIERQIEELKGAVK